MILKKPGHWGCEVWFRKGVQFACTSGGVKSYFDPKCVTVLLAHPRLLATHMRIGSQSLVVVSAHAPHEGAQEETKNEWWSMLQRLLSRHRNLGRWCILGDFNARLGLPVEHSIGDLFLDHQENNNGERLSALCADFGLWIPSTYDCIHSGQSYTWTHPKGARARLDYVILSDEEWSYVSSKVDSEVVTSNAARDHELARVDCSWVVTTQRPQRRQKVYDWEAMHTSEGRVRLQQVVDNLPAVDWNTDIHLHWQILEDSLHQGLAASFPPPPKLQREDIFSANTWYIRDNKIRRSKNLSTSSMRPMMMSTTG